MLTDVLRVHPTVEDRWYVTNGATAVGPVNFALLARGIEAGKVPLESFVRHEHWTVWRPLADIAVLEDGAPPASDDVCEPARPTNPDDITPADALAGAADLHDALLLVIAAATRQLDAEAALVERLDDDGAVVVCAHGPKMFEVLGARRSLVDPLLIAAAAGNVVTAPAATPDELPEASAPARSLLDRQARLGIDAGGALALPIRPRERLFGVLELGRRRPFEAHEIALARALVDELVWKIEAHGWHG